MTQQLSMFDFWQPAAIRLPVDPHGGVIQGEPDETLTLPQKRLAWPLARIELHQNHDGRWMWSASGPSGGYRVGPKWGRFAETRAGALHHALIELRAACSGDPSPESMGISAAQLRQLMAWLSQLEASIH